MKKIKKKYFEYKELNRNTIEQMKKVEFYLDSVYGHGELNSLAIENMKKYIENLDKVFPNNSMDDVPF